MGTIEFNLDQIIAIISVTVGVGIAIWSRLSSSKQERLLKWEQEYDQHSKLIGRDILSGLRWWLHPYFV